MMNPDLDGLRLSMLKEAVPSAKRIAVIYNPNEPASVNELRKTGDAAAWEQADALSKSFVPRLRESSIYIEFIVRAGCPRHDETEDQAIGRKSDQAIQPRRFVTLVPIARGKYDGLQ
jgi:hypothetical protein